jgi:DNA-binding transcriptional ArsR family regulator
MSPRDEEVFGAIEEEGLSTFSFDGLRRITGVHPETLSRSLERLEEDGIVVKSPEGYVVTDKGRGLHGLRPADAGAKRIPILHTFLPYASSARAAASALKGRWFGDMRWVGMTEDEEGLVMKWVSDDGRTLLDAKFTSGQLDVAAKVAGDADLPRAVRAAHQLLERVSKVSESTRSGNRIALMRVDYRPVAM